jgi:glycosyltransferase involved in cell wall biosynthesis
MGKAIVSTSIGCEGLAAVDGENILIRDTADGFAEAVAQVLADIPLRERLGRAGRVTVEQQYGWELIGRHMVELYREVIMSGVAESASVFPAPGGAY